MKTINLGKSGLKVPAVAVGCMRMGDLEQKEADNYIAEAVDMGAVFLTMPISTGRENVRRCSGNTCMGTRRCGTGYLSSPNAALCPA